MNDKIKGLVLNINDYKENDVILQIISEDKGFLSLIVKGQKKINTKRHFNNLCLYEFIIDYKDNKTIYTLHNGKLIESYYEDNDLMLLAFKNIIVELCYKSKELYEKEMYFNIVHCLKMMNKNNLYLLGSLFVSYILKINGISPNVDECVICGNKKVISISNSYGGFLCEAHKGEEIIYDQIRLKKFRLINKANYNNYELIDIDYDFKDFMTIINFYIINSETNVKAYKFYKDLYLND